MRILITGANGLIGSALSEHLRSRQHVVVSLSHRDLDITDRVAVHDSVTRLQPEVIINCAVIGVDDCEKDPIAADRINIHGPTMLAEMAQRNKAVLIHFSTNYVFDGQRGDEGFYTIEDEPKPISVYGTTKLEGEREVLSRCERGLVIRTSWVFGSGKESFLSTAHSRLADGLPVQAIRDVFASTTYVGDLVPRVERLLDLDARGTYHVVNSGVCSYATFALQAAKRLDLSREQINSLVDLVSEADMKRPARRPRWTPMRCVESERLGLRPLRPWTDALNAYIDSHRAR